MCDLLTNGLVNWYYLPLSTWIVAMLQVAMLNLSIIGLLISTNVGTNHANLLGTLLGAIQSAKVIHLSLCLVSEARLTDNM